MASLISLYSPDNLYDLAGSLTSFELCPADLSDFGKEQHGITYLGIPRLWTIYGCSFSIQRGKSVHLLCRQYCLLLSSHSTNRESHYLQHFQAHNIFSGIFALHIAVQVCPESGPEHICHFSFPNSLKTYHCSHDKIGVAWCV